MKSGYASLNFQWLSYNECVEGHFMKLGKQSVFYNAFFLCMSSIGLQLIGFVYRIGLSRFGGAEVMGMYQLIMPAYSVIMSFTMSGLTLAVSRLCAQYQAAGDSAGVRGVVRFSQLIIN